MKVKLLLLIPLLVLAIGLGMPSGPAAADGANHVYFTATSVHLCSPENQDPRCNGGTLTPLPNGKFFLTGWVNVIEFTAEDPRWTAECIFTGDPFPPANPNAYPVNGSFVCTPTDPNYANGWWEGTVNEVLMPDRWIAEFRAKGYGDFDRLITISRNTMHNTNEIEIIELPGYQP